MDNNKREQLDDITYQHISEHIKEWHEKKRKESFIAGYERAAEFACSSFCALCDFSPNGKKPFKCETFPCNRYRLFRKSLEENILNNQ